MALPAAAKGNPRVVAAQLLAQLARGRSVSDLLERGLDDLDPRDRGLVKEFCFGVARWRPRLEAIAGRLMSKPIKPKEGEVQALILLGLYQLIHMRVAPHAAVAETVEAVRLLNKRWAVGLTNALLRRFQRECAQHDITLAGQTGYRTAHPPWLAEAFGRDWPEQAEALMAANNDRAPMTLRVNRTRGTRAAYLERLAAAGIPATPTAHSPDGIRLAMPQAVTELPGFDAGLVSVQDEAAQL
ncbi:MAG TPA: transcription antitermination factor NusB, partial [Paracoccaceae bacterium]|nr:transcription antitermination factor NusB [Paracoccaceae bacterium]